MKRLLATAVVGACLLGTASAQTPVTGSQARAAVRAVAGTTEKMMNQIITEISFEDAAFEEVMKWVADYTQMNVQVRWQTLTDAGVDRDKRITVQVKNVRLSQFLWMVMNEAGGSDIKLAYRASGNLLIMSTVEDLGKEMLLRVYDVSDLLVMVRRFQGPRIDTNQALQGASQGGQGGGGSSGQLFRDEDENEDRDQGGDDAGEADMQRLITLITQTVEPDTWTDGGGLGTISAFRRQLVVRNNILVHQRLAGRVEEDSLAP